MTSRAVVAAQCAFLPIWSVPSLHSTNPLTWMLIKAFLLDQDKKSLKLHVIGEKTVLLSHTQAAASSTTIYEALHTTVHFLLFIRLIYKKNYKCEKSGLQSAITDMHCTGSY